MAERRNIEAYTSLEILEEINRVLHYDRVLKILQRSRTDTRTIMAIIIRLSSIIDVKSKVHAITEDRSDNKILACALDADADYVVTGDCHLAELEEYRGIRIVTAAGFLGMKAGPSLRKHH